MEIVGIIAEYNPFHNGHLYHLTKIREMYKDALIILVLNGYFLERGEVSIISKENKTKLALSYGVDIVVELPFLYGTQSSDTFANISLQILNELKVSKIVFGSECNDINKLNKLAEKQLNESIDVKKYLNEGYNYPTSLNKALNSNVSTPNDILGISYIKALKKNNYKIEAITIKRTNDYHDLQSKENIISASNIRNKIKNKEDIKSYLPNTDYLNQINEDLLFTLLKYKINTSENLNEFLTVDEGLENKLKKEINKVTSLEDLIFKIKSKRYTYNRLRRMLIHLLIGVKKSDAKIKLSYIKLLGFNERGKKYINKIKKKVNIPLLTKIPLDDKVRILELRASILYEMLTKEKVTIFENKNKPIY